MEYSRYVMARHIEDHVPSLFFARREGATVLLNEYQMTPESAVKLAGQLINAAFAITVSAVQFAPAREGDASPPCG